MDKQWLIYRLHPGRWPVGIVEAPTAAIAVKKAARDWYDYQIERPVVIFPGQRLLAIQRDRVPNCDWHFVKGENRRRRLALTQAAAGPAHSPGRPQWKTW